MTTLAIDAMGGDYAPQAVIEGISKALDEIRTIDKLILVGDEIMSLARSDWAERLEAA